MSGMSDRAAQLFHDGYNCSQAVAGAFAQRLGADEGEILRLTSTLGGGIARMRSVCGAVTGMCVMHGLAKGSDQPVSTAEKGELYDSTRALCDAFAQRFGTLNCGELLKKHGKDAVTTGGAPQPRDASFYARRPCEQFVRYAAELLEQALEEK